MKKIILNCALLIMLLSLTVEPVLSSPARPEKVFGWIEEGILLPENIAVKIKLDTGALTSSHGCEGLKKIPKRWRRMDSV